MIHISETDDLINSNKNKSSFFCESSGKLIFKKPKLSVFFEFHIKLILSNIEKALCSFFVNLVKPLIKPFCFDKIKEIEELSPYFFDPK